MTHGWKYVLRQYLFILLVLLLCLVFLAIGLMIGYSVIGDGGNPLSILSPAKWVSLINKFTGN
ncbi:DNA-directed RNA polymerase subunit beta [Streptococcus loxodontisalivarius]|uniref:DNA-directed RNA polymerase subunit beta n=1 Tax=Streptococcus loxodontisalivarius TaxID=1349415 RepID=A0ABS2PS00_9STRE|nr:DNA-directed RNA polymerase subunit beta [Streptococcus loxodontisalivarius]MBM7642157.1 hypothetical protein [Streptococcus loxodontisalivarius]